MAVQELQAGGAGLRFEDVDDGWDALPGGEWRVGPAEPSPMVAGVDEPLGRPVIRVAGGVTAHQLVERGFAGHNAVHALTALADQLTGKVLVDYAVPFICNPDTEHPWPTPWGVMPRLEPVDTDSLGEQIQRALPDVKVVKASHALIWPARP
ncbi:hypothetical protein AB8O64_33310 [Streptomyces sp. QH1-20]|uniref:hypothetical protein n=1 Tax=Streptomyces sp. QH1-20 TaxID=3240934 RepID=UPI003519B8F2